MKASVGPEADRELTDAAVFYAREGGAEVGLAFIAEYERVVALLCAHPKLGALWKNNRRRFPLRRAIGPPASRGTCRAPGAGADTRFLEAPPRTYPYFFTGIQKSGLLAGMKRYLEPQVRRDVRRKMVTTASAAIRSRAAITT